VRCWSAGCAAGEEPYTLSILRRHALPRLRLDVLATDAAPHQLERARAAVYSASSLKEVPEAWRGAAFPDGFQLRPDYREGVRFALQDLREAMPDGPFDLILCRNLAFTYYEEDLQREILAGLAERLAPDGILAIGRHERLPQSAPRLRVLPRPD
jgi:chemotaxis protein methyltransferase CheR